MINVEFRTVGSGKCRWCKKDKDEVIELKFSDGSFVGHYCFADFKKALLDKLENAPAKPAIPVAVQPLGQSNGSGYGPPGGTTTDSVAKAEAKK